MADKHFQECTSLQMAAASYLFYSTIYADPCARGSQYLCPIGTQRLFSKAGLSVLSGHLAAPFHSCHNPKHYQARSRAAYFPSLPTSLFHNIPL